MQKRITVALLTGSLLLLGAGCTARQSATTSLETAPPAEEAGMEASADAALKVRAEAGDVDATVDILIDGAAEESALQDELSGDASDLTSDSAEINAYGQAEYDLK